MKKNRALKNRCYFCHCMSRVSLFIFICFIPCCGFAATYMTGTNSGTNGTYTLTSNWNCPNPNGGQVNVAENVNYIISSGVTVNISGNLRISGHLIIEDGASLNVSGSIIMDCYTGKSVLEANGSLSAGSISYASNKYPNNVSIQLSNSTNIAGDVELQTSSVLTIPSGARIHIPGDLTNNGTINCNGRLVVGTLDEDVPDGKTIIKSNGTITNLGTININTSDEALSKTQLEPKLDNSVYYAAITCGNLVNGKNQTSSDIGTINMYDGSLIVQDNAKLWYKSKILFKKGQSYIDVWGNLIQLDKTYNVKGEEAIVKLNGTGAKAQINVRETYEDWTTLGNERDTHDWDLDNNQFTINPNVQLSVGKYYTGKTEYLDEETYRVNDWGNLQATTSITKDVYTTDYSYIGGKIGNYTEQIENLNSQKASLTAPDGEEYLYLIGEWGEEEGANSAAGRIADINAEISELQSLVENLNLIKSFAEDNLTGSQLEDLNDWFFSTAYGEWFVTQNLYIRVKKSKNSYEYKSYLNYFYYDYIYNHNNHLKLYHYILAYMDAYGNDAQYYEGRHNALSVMLPIELSYFEVSQSEDELSFDWATESESNNDYFTIEYSLDGNNFYSIATVAGAGNSSEQLFYRSSVSADRFSGVVYFRLRQTDFDGQSTYSETHAINVQGINERFEIYPNPATTVITISGEEFSSVVFVDSHSKTYPALSLGGGTYSVENLSRGMYFAVIITTKGTAVKEFMVTK